ncbi:MAG: hypothetical protein B7Z43_11530 [Sphingomonas sp. 12-62-6]|nr:MAG: hypothetical protein B7Z43_11530 [Sphingomonas sp. 12-62-6]
MPNLSTILAAKAPLTLAGVPTGFLPWLLANLARAATTRAVFIASDDASYVSGAEFLIDGAMIC